MIFNKLKLPGVIFEITSKCNLKCRYCYNHWKREEENLEIKEDSDFKKTLRKFLSMANVDVVTMSGGEPTFNFNELLDAIMITKARNKRVNLITNANLLNKEKVDLLIKLKVDLYEITINSYDKEIHEKINCIKGSFDKSINIIKYLLEKNCKVVVPIVITKDNVDNIDKTLEFIYNLGVKDIMVNRYNIGGFGCNEYNEILPSYDNLKFAFERCNKFAKEKNITIYSLVCTPRCVINPKDYSNIFFSHCGCDNLNRQYTLTRSGDIRYCNHSPYVLGNIYEKNMKEILKSDRLNQWKDTVPDFCKECVIKDECQYGCRAASEQLGYGLNKEDPIVNIYGIKENIKFDNNVMV